MNTWQAELFARRRRGVQLGIDRLSGVDNALNHPSAGKTVIQIVGTNGKGSTAAMLAHGLGALGQQVGLYTSPHLHQLRERIKINGTKIDDLTLEKAIQQVVAIEHDLSVTLTFFEILTFAALLIFESQAVSHIVLEAGLGGRLDATRIRDATLHLITPIGIDHQSYLGSTLAEIAYEKAAVMRSATQCFSVDQDVEAKKVIEKVAEQTGAHLDWAKPLGHVPKGMRGEFQRINAGLAYAGLCYLARTINRGAISDELLDNTEWPGRFEQHPIEKGTVTFDVAHNFQGISAIVEHSQRNERYDQIVFGCTADKDAKAMIQELRRMEGEICFVPPASDHDSFDFRSIAESREEIFSSPYDRLLLDTLGSSLRAGRRILICGSHFVVAPLRAYLLNISPENIDPSNLFDPVSRCKQSLSSVESMH